MNKLINSQNLFLLGLLLIMALSSCSTNEKKENETTEKIDKRLVNKDSVYTHFLSWLESFENERDAEVNTDEYKFKVILSDINKDGYDDGLVEFNHFIPSNGSRLWNIGYVYFQNTPNGLKFIQIFDGEDEFLGSTSEVKYLSNVNGDLKFEMSRYAEGDAYCCPSIKTIEHYKIINGKFSLQEIEEEKFLNSNYRAGAKKTCIGRLQNFAFGDLAHYDFILNDKSEFSFNDMPAYADKLTIDDPNSEYGERLNPKFINREFRITFREFEPKVFDEFSYPITGVTSIMMLK